MEVSLLIDADALVFNDCRGRSLVVPFEEVDVASDDKLDDAGVDEVTDDDVVVDRDDEVNDDNAELLVFTNSGGRSWAVYSKLDGASDGASNKIETMQG